MLLFPRRAYGQLEWSDVREFLTRRVPENELLDYKREPTKDIEVTIAAGGTHGAAIDTERNGAVSEERSSALPNLF